MDIVIFLYDGVTALDAIGPYQVFITWPDARVRFVAKQAGPITSLDIPLLVATHSIAEVSSADILCIPGAPEQFFRAAAEDEEVLQWVRDIDQTTRYTTTVCTGSVILAAAGLLNDKKATTHWCFYHELAAHGAIPVSDRVIRQGKIITSAGISSGIDMALSLTAWEFGDDSAQFSQLRLEYDPQPPFDAGSPETAPAHVVQAVRDFYFPPQ